MLEVRGIKTSYGKIQILRGVDLDLDNHQIVSMIGPNGAGKTTLMKAISGLIKPDAGTISLDGTVISNKKAYEVISCGVTMVPEGRLIFPKMTVLENLEMGACVVKDRIKIKENIEYVFDIFPRLKERKDQYGGTMSGGEQQMLAIGRGLMSNPKLLILDEPSLGLAPIMVKEVYNVVQDVFRKTNISILLVEQNAKMAFKIADYVYVMENGRFVMHGPKNEIMNDPAVKKAYLGG